MNKLWVKPWIVISFVLIALYCPLLFMVEGLKALLNMIKK